jgi:catechol 2,3-dioxygenase-like lactoylglutathione lyase family enzyme
MITGVNHVTLCISDTDRSLDFYSRVLGCRPAAKWSGGVYLSAGETWLALVKCDGGPDAGRDYAHLALSCPEPEFDSLIAAIRAEGCAEWSENNSEGAWFYFCDPDGNRLEIHVGDLQSRLAAMAQWDPAEKFRLFD